jgi:hypothetical protein
MEKGELLKTVPFDSLICSRLDGLAKITVSSLEQPVTLDRQAIEIGDGMGIHQNAGRAHPDSSIWLNCKPSSNGSAIRSKRSDHCDCSLPNDRNECYISDVPSR